jgi:two-component system sensor histidine kinase TctE
MNAEPVHTTGSLRNRLAVTLIGGAAVLTLLFYFVIRNYATQIAQKGQDSILQASVTSVLDAAAIRNGVVEIDIPYAAFSMLGTPTDDRVFYAIYQDGALLSGYDALQPALLETDTDTVFQTRTFMETSVRQVTASRPLVGVESRTRITASIAQTQDSLAGTLSRISRNAALFGAGFFALAVLLSVWATSTTISPLKRLADSVGRRGPQDLSAVAKPVPTEMVPLVSSLNSLMARLEKSLKQSEDFIAEAAHRVRTPIATVRSHAEMTLQRVDKEDNRQALRSMIRAIDETSRAAGQLLDHAMITFRASQHEFQDVDLLQTTEETVLRLTPIADMKDVQLNLKGDHAVTVSGDPILIQSVVRNLIDNALKYAPGESIIDIEVCDNPVPLIEVRDQGPGFPLDEMDTLTDRFTRGRNASDTIGSGLGLTIARDVADAHGGKLVISNNATGGACVTLSF